MSDTHPAPPENNSPGWSDEPTADSAQDRLGRSPFADMVAAQMNGIAVGQPSTVFGLVGPWGSGKTSLLGMIRGQLDGTWTVADFAPWSASDSTGLTLEFLNALASAIPEDAGGRELRTTIRKYSRFATPLLSAIPLFGGAIQAVAEQGVDAFTAGKPWHEEFDKLSSLLRERGQRVLIVADDIDRLDGLELMTLLRVIRLLGRFPNVHYIIAYDQTTIESNLRGQGQGAGPGSFMEKIVQYPFEVPPMGQADKRNMLGAALSEVFASMKWVVDVLSGREERAAELLRILPNGLHTPRALARLREQLLAHANLMKLAEIDAIDFAALTYLRLFHHELWGKLGEWKEALLTGQKAIDLAESTPITHQEWSQRLSGVVSEPDSATAKEVLSFLFPDVKLGFSSSFGAHERALSDKDYFERYFVVGIPTGDISDQLIEDALRDIELDKSESDAVNEYSSVLDGPDDDWVTLALQKGSQLRQATAAASSGVVEFLQRRLKIPLTSGRAGFMSSTAVLRTWLGREVQLALSNKVLDHQGLVDIFGADDTLYLFATLGRGDRVAPTDVSRLKAQAWDIYGNELRNDLDSVIKTPGKIDAIMSLATETGQLSGILDTSLQGRLDLYLRFLESLVQVKTWTGSRSSSYEIEFQRMNFQLLVSETVRHSFVPQLPVSRPITDFELDDLPSQDFEPGYLKEFAVANAKLETDGTGLLRPA